MQIQLIYQILVLHMEKHKKLINNNTFKILAPTWNDKFDIPDGSYSVPVIQDHF